MTLVNPGDPVTFKVRFFNRRDNAGGETWDFGDGTPREETKSNPVGDHATDGYAEIVHTYNDPGRYIVTVSGTTSKGEPCMAHHFVLVGQ